VSLAPLQRLEDRVAGKQRNHVQNAGRQTGQVDNAAAAYIPAAVRGDISWWEEPCWEEGTGDRGPLFTALTCIVSRRLLPFVEPRERVPLPRDTLPDAPSGVSPDEEASASASDGAPVGVTRRTALISKRIAVCFRRDGTGIRCSR
jgi:hypothetical protein